MADRDTGAHEGVEIDQPTGQPTTGHVWDGIRELNTPLPRWWLWTFYATIAFAVVYVVLYPAIPLVHSATRGLLGYSTRAAVETSLVAAQDAQSANLQRIASMSLEDIAKDEELNRFAVAGGRSAFLVNCVQCHGSGAAGSVGYPNLNDDDWLWGGTLDAIHTTILHGIRYTQDPDTRVSEMPAFGADGMLDAHQIEAVANFVLSLSGGEHDAALAEEGKQIFADNCAALSRRRWWRQPRARRATAERRHLALFRHQGRDHRADQQAAPRRDAGLGAPARRHHDQGAHPLRSFARRRRSSDLGAHGADGAGEEVARRPLSSGDARSSA